MSKITKVKISENYEAVKNGIRKIGTRAVECGGVWNVGQGKNGDSYIKFYANTIASHIPQEVKENSELGFYNDSDPITDYRMVDKLRVNRSENTNLFNSLIHISVQW